MLLDQGSVPARALTKEAHQVYLDLIKDER